ncbi:hypothetical protein HCH_00899 [Hahella chejuensis KCTC 2396]|uniref:Uncharacterized protein n=1 Tax=Hahella chejuensis (strain KCTC 2396) TaxID=349521 RepID=Q2SNI4_HAHCH|nr:hypothetical protein [Hahella chejuensis]ABC27790.1 hypothetical protein HCH_00899 [Hahella chejuensis KCTC 2396]
MDWIINSSQRNAIHPSGLELFFYAFGGELRELMLRNIPEELSASEVRELVQDGEKKITNFFGLESDPRKVHILL